MYSSLLCCPSYQPSSGFHIISIRTINSGPRFRWWSIFITSILRSSRYQCPIPQCSGTIIRSSSYPYPIPKCSGSVCHPKFIHIVWPHQESWCSHHRLQCHLCARNHVYYFAHHSGYPGDILHHSTCLAFPGNTIINILGREASGCHPSMSFTNHSCGSCLITRFKITRYQLHHGSKHPLPFRVQSPIT